MPSPLAARIARLPQWLLLVFVLYAATPCAAQTVTAPAAASTVTAADRDLGRRLDQRLEAVPDLARVDASVTSGVALLQGEVIEPDDLKLAESIATQTEGIARVEN